MKRANAEGWKLQQKEAYSKAAEKAQQKTAEAAANNAAKLERAKSLAIDRLVNVLEHFPANSGDMIRQYGKDKNGNKFTNQFSLLDIVAAIEKLEKNSTIDEADDPLMEMLKRWDDAAAGE